MVHIPEDYGQATCVFTGVNLPHNGAIVFGFKNIGSQSASACATDVFNCMGGVVDNMCSSDVQLDHVDVKLGPNDTGGQGTSSGTPVVGAVGNATMAPGTAVLVEKSCLEGGRRARGRMYWPGVYEGWVGDQGLLESGIVAQVNGFMLTLRAALTTVDVPMYILHSPSYTWVIQNGQPRRVYDSPAGLPEPYFVTDLTCDPRVATQRRRNR